MDINQLTAMNVTGLQAGETLTSGGGISLRLMTEDDINERYLSWFEDPIVTRFLDAKNLSRDDALNYLRFGKAHHLRYQFAVCDTASGNHIGSVKLGDIDHIRRMSDLVTVIGDRRYWGKGVATAAIRSAINLAFNAYGIRKICASIDSENIASLKAYTRAGCLVEAVLFAHHFSTDGRATNRVIVSCFNPIEYPIVPNFPLDTRHLI